MKDDKIVWLLKREIEYNLCDYFPVTFNYLEYDDIKLLLESLRDYLNITLKEDL